MRALVALAVFLSAPALAGELALNEVEQRLGIAYVQDRVVLDVHGPAPMFGDVGRSYRNPDYEDDWQRAYCYAIYWREEVIAAKRRREISVQEMNPIERALARDQNDIKLENADSYDSERSLFLRLRANVRNTGLDACNG